jgi:hypothetical protein
VTFQPNQPSTNGVEKAPPIAGGASAGRPQRKPATFLPDPPIRTFAAGGYASHRFLLGGAPASRYLSALLLLLALSWLTGLLPMRWPGFALFTALFLAHVVSGQVLKRRNYVTFDVGPLPTLTPAPLDGAKSLPVYVTGNLSVEGRAQRFTFLPGFYKSFATREHALLCQVRPRRLYRILQWPLDEVGMWYAFMEPQAIRSLQWGTISFAPHTMPAIAIEYDVIQVTEGRLSGKKSETRTVETLFVASADEAVLKSVVADLLADEAGAPALQRSGVSSG